MEDHKKTEERRKNTERKRLQLQRMTLEQRKELFARNSARRSAKRAEKAIAEGRTPGKPGTKALSPEEKDFCDRAKYAIWRLKNLDVVRKKDVELHRQIRAEKAVA